MCDSCYDIHGPKDSGAKSEGGQDLPPGKLVRKARRVVGPDGVEQIVYDNFDLPEEYLSSSLANQVIITQFIYLKGSSIKDVRKILQNF